MDTTKNNKLIAEFMGLKRGRGTNRDRFTYITPNGGVLPLRYLEYNNSWNWLMPVVEKIETMSLTENKNHLPEFFIMYDQREDFKGWYWSISITKLFRKECLGRENTKIGAFYAAVVEFIKWYNDQEK